MIIDMRDLRASGMCRRGVQLFFEHHKLDYHKFRVEGIDATELLATGDALAQRAVEDKNGRLK